MIIYRIFNKKNGKSYIGQTIYTFNERYKGNWIKNTHNIILKNSIDKNGAENFDFEILEENVDSIEKLNELEVYYSEKYNSYRPNGYNIRGCGDNKFVDNELKEHLSTFRLGTNYKPNNKKSSVYKGVYWRESKKTWMCRFYNSIIKKTKYTNSEIEAAETYDKVSLYLFGKDCFINFEEKRLEYLKLNLKDFYENNFLKKKEKRKDGYYKDDIDLLNSIKPLIWEMSIPKIAKKLDLKPHVVSWCIKKHNLERPGRDYWKKKL